MVIRVNDSSIHPLPVLHGRMEFAKAVRRKLLAIKPDVVAIELPFQLSDGLKRAVKRLPFLSVLLCENEHDDPLYLLIEPQDALIEAARYAEEENIPLRLVDLEVEGYPRKRQSMPDPLALNSIGYEAYVTAYLEEFSGLEADRFDSLRERYMAYQVHRLTSEFENIAFVFGISHYPRLADILSEPQAAPLAKSQTSRVTLARLHEDSSREVLSEPPFLCAEYEKSRLVPRKLESLNRLNVHHELFEAAVAAHLKKSKERVTTQQKIVFHQFARNYSLVQGYLAPDFYQLVIAARGAVDDNFAYELWEIGSTYPWQDDSPSLPELRISGEDLFLNNKRIHFHRRLRHFRRRLVPAPLRKRPREKRSGQWKEQWTGVNICSYPPEDIAIEGFGHYLKKKAVKILSEENQRVVPFTTSLMDGLNLRETIRNWNEGKIYVNENGPTLGKVGAVVIIFDEDRKENPRDESFPWKLTWLGEHDQESDMALYASPPGEVMVGPGISRCHHGGFMLTYPPFRLLDIWSDPFFDWARTKPERLLMAALDYNLERNVVYVAATPPPSNMKSFADKLGKRILYIPIGTFSPTTLRKMRTFHVLDGHRVRGYATDYISS